MHLSPEDIARVLASGSSAEGLESVDAHIDQCPACRKLLSEAIRGRLASAPTLVETRESAGLEVGTVIDQRYRIERLVGLGGMGSVYEAHHLFLNQRVALKFMLPELARDLSAVERFTREGRAAARLSGAHVGRVLDLGKLADDTPFLVMEFLVGESVEQRLEREGRFPPTVVLEAAKQAALALEEAHAAGIVHRDIKPANLFYARRSDGTEVLKVLDFGIAKSIHPDIEAGLGATRPNTMLGSPMYMSPEQISGRPTDGRADLWGLGVTLYQMLSGRPPFDDKELVELLYSVEKRAHAPLTQVPPALSAVIDRCLSKDPERRPASARAFIDSLEAIRDSVTGAKTERPRPRWPFAVAAGAVLLVVIAWGIKSSQSETTPPIDPVPAVPTRAEVVSPVPPPVDATPRIETVPTSRPPTVKPATVSAPSKPKGKAKAVPTAAQPPRDVLEARE